MSAPRILVPCKAFATGKSRLAPILSPAERAAFCRDRLVATLALAGRLAPSRVAVVSGAREVLALARAWGARGIAEDEPGLNAALDAGRRALGAGAPLLVLPIDLPCADVRALQRLTTTGADVALAPDAEGLGTNALWLAGPAVAPFRFAFGERSRVAHEREAGRLGLGATIVEDASLALDIDDPERYRAWANSAARERLSA